MDGLIRLLFDNPFLLFVVIAGLISFFNRLKSSNREQGTNEQQNKEQTERPKQSPVREMMKRIEEMAESLEADSSKPQKTAQEKNVEAKQSAESRTYSFEEQRDEQFKQLQKQYQTAQDDEMNKMTIDKDSPILHDSKLMESENKLSSPSAVKVNMKSRLNKEGLVESIVMSEVLGPPRARKKYSNRYLERHY